MTTVFGRRRPRSAIPWRGSWGRFIATILVLQQRYEPAAATPQFHVLRVEDLAKGTSKSLPTFAGNGNATAAPLELFSEAWEEQYGSGRIGCELGRKRYYWRQCGLGSNILHLLNAFVYALAVKNWSDVAIVSQPGQLGALTCTGEDGSHLTGYPCLFGPMPHVCIFETQQEWNKFMMSKGVSWAGRTDANKMHWQYLRSQGQRNVQAAALEQLGTDTFGALGMMARFLWKHLTPWLEEDVRVALERPDVQALRQKPYIGFHIRRGDKVAEGEAKKVATKEYLSAALKHLNDRERHGGDGAKDIKGIWVASDSQNAVREVRALASQYFPNVSKESIVWISGGSDGGPVATHSKFEEYAGFVLVFADLKLLSAASVFVGTFSSNVSRVVALMREGIERKARDSCISLDKEFGVQY